MTNAKQALDSIEIESVDQEVHDVFNLLLRLIILPKKRNNLREIFLTTEQLAYAVSQRKTFLTHNRADFETLAKAYFTAGRTRYRIILAVRHPHEIVWGLLLILNYVTADEMQDQVRYI